MAKCECVNIDREDFDGCSPGDQEELREYISRGEWEKEKKHLRRVEVKIAVYGLLILLATALTPLSIQLYEYIYEGELVKVCHQESSLYENASENKYYFELCLRGGGVKP